MKKNILRVLSIILTGVMLFSFVSCGKKEKQEAKTEQPDKTVEQVNYTEKAKSYRKSETVYVNLSSDGEVKTETVIDWLHTEKAKTYIDDVTDLKNIVNVKGETEPIKIGKGSYRWNMDTTDLYYRGTTKKDLPVHFNITYYLDGKQMSAEKIAGKSGQVKMVITVTNTMKKEVKIKDNRITVYTPFVVAGGMILQEDNFSNISVENGRTIGDGTKEIVILAGVPGLKESLNLTDEMLKELGDFSFSDTYTITAETKKFEISNCIFTAIPLSSVLSEAEYTLPNTVSDIKTTLNDVQGIINKFNALNIDEITDILFSGNIDIKEIISALNDATKLYNENKALIELGEKYLTPENIKVIDNFVKDAKKLDIDEITELLSNPILQKIFKELPALSEDMKNISPLLKNLDKDLNKPDVKKAIDNLPKTLETLKQLKKVIEKNKSLAEKISSTFDEKTLNSLADIISSVKDIFDDDMLEKYGTIAENADELIARAEAWLKQGTEYKIFTTASDDADTSTLFIYETESVG